jgi:hypothetical protein
MQAAAHTSAVARRPANTRNIVSNGTRLHRRGIDLRTRAAKRYRDLFENFAEGLGGESSLTEAERALARTAAALAVKSEALQAQTAQGGDVDAEALVRVANALARVIGRLGAKRPPAPVKTLADHLAEVAARKGRR